MNRKTDKKHMHCCLRAGFVRFFAIYVRMFDFKDVFLNWLGVLYESQLF